MFPWSVSLLLRRHGVDSGGLRRFLVSLTVGSLFTSSLGPDSPSQSDVRPPRRVQSIGTLDPSRLRPSDCLTVSRVCRPRVSTANAAFLLPQYHAKQGRTTAFPAGSRGFLYLANAEEPVSSWQMRFRVTSSDSPEGFDAGADLLLPNQEPWIMALKKLGRKQLAAVRDVLVGDGSLSDALVSLDVNPIHAFTNLCNQHATRPRTMNQSIQTLDPARLRFSDYLDLAGALRPQISTQNSKCLLEYNFIGGERIPFPPSARGFLYFRTPEEEPDVTWQIRFRVTEHDSPTSFECGSDLLYPNQTPWFVSLSALRPHRGPLFTLRELLVRDGLDVDRIAERSTERRGAFSKPFIHSLGQLFHVDFQHYKLNVAFVGFGADSKFERPMISPLSTNVRSKSSYIRYRPYAGSSLLTSKVTVPRSLLTSKPGSALCCFEAHSSPGSTYPDRLALRVKKIITPVTTVKPELAYRIPIPQEGELVMKYTRAQKCTRPGSVAKTFDPQPWTLDAPTTAHPVVQAILHGKTV